MSIPFSMTLLATTLASSQYTSRILRNLLCNGVTQGTLTSVDYLTAILARLACRQFPPSHRYDGEALRMITHSPGL